MKSIRLIFTFLLISSLVACDGSTGLPSGTVNSNFPQTGTNAEAEIATETGDTVDATATGDSNNEGSTEGQDANTLTPVVLTPIDNSSNTPPTAVVSDVSILFGNTAILDASESTDVDNDGLGFWWELTSTPSDSRIEKFEIIGNETFEFTPDVTGTYRFNLTISDGRQGVDTAVALVHATLPVINLDFKPVDAEYSDSLDRIIVAAESPNQLIVLNPETAESTRVALNLPPTAVSVSPDGLYAAVAHDAWVTYIDLLNNTVLYEHRVMVYPNDIVLAGNGYAYIFPRNADEIHKVELSSGIQSTLEGPRVGGHRVGKLHPDGQSIFSVGSRSTSRSLRKYDISNTTNDDQVFIVPEYNLPNNDTCGDLWISEDGSRVYSSCGDVFNQLSGENSEITELGLVLISNRITDPFARMKHFDQTQLSEEISFIEEGRFAYNATSTYVNLSDEEHLWIKQKIAIPRIFDGPHSFTGHGEYIFYSSGGDSLYVMLQTNPEDGLRQDRALWKVVRD